MNTFITIMLVLAALAWAAWNFYGQYWWRARKWEEEQRKDRRLVRMEERKARKIASLKFEEAAHGTAALQKRAEELRRQRTGENLIYETLVKRRFLDNRSGGKRPDTNNNTNLS